MGIQRGRGEMTIGARLLPLSGKYYGTKIEVVWESEKTELSIWKMGDYIPSTRQLEYWECTYQEAKEDDLMCDSHY